MAGLGSFHKTYLLKQMDLGAPNYTYISGEQRTAGHEIPAHPGLSIAMVGGEQATDVLGPPPFLTTFLL